MLIKRHEGEVLTILISRVYSYLKRTALPFGFQFHVLSLDSPEIDCPDHDDVIKWKHFPRNWPFMRGIHRSPVNSPHKGQWRRALMFSFVCVNDWVNNREAGDLICYRAHYDVIVMRRPDACAWAPEMDVGKVLCDQWGIVLNLIGHMGTRIRMKSCETNSYTLQDSVKWTPLYHISVTFRTIQYLWTHFNTLLTPCT